MTHQAIIGTWEATTTFVEGSRKGDIQKQRFIFEENGTVHTYTTQNDHVRDAQGIWFTTDHGTVIYTVSEDITVHGVAGRLTMVHETIPQDNATTYISQGQGYLTTNGKIVFRSVTQTEATRWADTLIDWSMIPTP